MDAVSALSRLQSMADRHLPLPAGAVNLGAADHPERPGGGSLVRLASGVYVIAAAGVLRTCPQRWATTIAAARS
jgi:hypothetical protein